MKVKTKEVLLKRLDEIITDDATIEHVSVTYLDSEWRTHNYDTDSDEVEVT